MAKKTNMSDFGDFPRSGHTSADITRAMIPMSEEKSTFGKRVFAFVLPTSLIAAIVLSPFNIWQSAYNIPRSLNRVESMTDKLYNPSIRVRYSELGREIINSWYTGGQQVVPVASGITWPDRAPVDLASKISDAQGTVDSAEINSLLSNASQTPIVTNVSFVTGDQTAQPISTNSEQYVERLVYNARVNGVLHTVTILLRIDDLADMTKLPTLIAEPSIGTAIDISKHADADDGPERVRSISFDENQTAQLTTWAKAYSADDRETLKRLTGDKKNDRVYVGIVDGGWSYVDGSLNVVWSKVEDDQDTSRARLKWQIQSTRDTGLRNKENKPIVQKVVQTQTMDVLLKGVNTALLSIVAWGDAGTYSKLESFGNAYSPDDAPPFGRKNVLTSEGSEVVDENTQENDGKGLIDEDPFAEDSDQSGAGDQEQSKQSQ